MEISDILRLVEQEREEAEVAKLFNFTQNNSRRQSLSYSSSYNRNYSCISSTTNFEGAEEEDEQPSSSAFMSSLSPNPISLSNMEIVQKIISMPVGVFSSQGRQLTPEEREVEERNIIDMKRLQIEIETGGDFSVGDNLNEILCFGRVFSGYTESGVFSSSSGGELKFPGMRIKSLDINSETSSPSAGFRKSKKNNRSKSKRRAKSLLHSNSTSEKHPVTTGIPPNSSRVQTGIVQHQQDQNGGRGRYQSAKRNLAVGESPKTGKQSKDIIMIRKAEMSQQSSSSEELLIQSIQRAIDKANADFKTEEEVLPVPVHFHDALGTVELTGGASEQNVAEFPSSDKFEYPHRFAEAESEVLHVISGPHGEEGSIVLPYRSSVVAVAVLDVTDLGMGSFVTLNEFEVELQAIVDETNYRASKIDDLFGEMDEFLSRKINDLDLII